MESAFIIIWIVLVIIFSLSAKASKFKKHTKNVNAGSFNLRGFSSPAKENSKPPKHDNQEKNYKTKQYKPKPPEMKILRDPKERGPLLFEDREHDWLAMQLKEEALVLRKGNSLDLGASHSASCDAKAIKLMHMLEHDDSIDRGEL